MIKVRGMPFKDEDDAVSYFRQREIDDAAEVQNALFEGKEAGRNQAPATANRYATGTPQAEAWERGRSSIEAQRVAEELKSRARRCCDPCSCGGRGLCRDAA